MARDPQTMRRLLGRVRKEMAASDQSKAAAIKREQIAAEAASPKPPAPAIPKPKSKPKAKPKPKVKPKPKQAKATKKQRGGNPGHPARQQIAPLINECLVNPRKRKGLLARVEAVCDELKIDPPVERTLKRWIATARTRQTR